MNYIKSINWILTYRCNLRCRHCDIWLNPYKKTIDILKFRNILESPIVTESKKYFWDRFDLALTGWEPFLIQNFQEMVDAADELLPGSLHAITTNGILKDEVIHFLENREDQGKKPVKLNVSLDGLSDMHDYQRGVIGSFRKTVETILHVRKKFPQQPVELKLTITKDNLDSVFDFTKLAYKLGVYFSFKPVENMPYYTNQRRSLHANFTENEIIRIRSQIIDNPYIREQNYYISPAFFEVIPEYLRNGLTSKSQCTVAEESITIMPDLQVYSCILMESIGNLDTESLDEIWQSGALSNMREKIKKGNCPGCMLMCGSFKTKKLFHA